MNSNEIIGDNLDLLRLLGAEMNELYKRKLRQLLEQEYSMDKLGTTLSNIRNAVVENKKTLRILNAKKNNNAYLWITVNPRSEVTFHDFKKKIEKLVNRKMFTHYEYVYEQRGCSVETAGKGFHCHILATRNVAYKPCKCISNIRNTCKNLVGDVMNNHQLNIQVIGDDFASDKREYMTGAKTGDGKDQKQIIDQHWRQAETLKNIYKKEGEAHP